jgi:hypothetical protein
MPIRSICAGIVILEFGAGDVHKLVGFHVVCPRFVGVVPVHQSPISMKDVLPVGLLRHRRIMLTICLFELSKGNNEGCH